MVLDASKSKSLTFSTTLSPHPDPPQICPRNKLKETPNAPPDEVCLETAGEHGMEVKHRITDQRGTRASHPLIRASRKKNKKTLPVKSGFVGD